MPRASRPKIEDLAFNRALEAIWQALDAANKYIVATAPFTLAKDPAKLPRVAQILANLLEGLRVVADALEPFMPVTSRKMRDMLNVDEHWRARRSARGSSPAIASRSRRAVPANRKEKPDR